MRILRQFLGLLLLAGLVESASAVSPNIVLITVDTVRTDRMGFMGSQLGLTPNLDALAKQGVVFSRAYAQVPITTASHAVILTGTYPQFNHVNDFAVPLGADLPYLPQILHDHGYKTAAFVGSMILDPFAGVAPGFDRGFDYYDAGFHARAPGQDPYQTLRRRGVEVVAHASAWLNENRGGPFFVWIHLFDPHFPYDPPEPFKTRYAAQPYDGEIAYADSALGPLIEQLRTLGLFDGALIAIMSDHGESLGDHGEQTHGIFLYDETIHVPLLFKMPAKRFSGERVEARASLIDLTPTVLEVAGIPAPAALQGASLVSLMQAADGSSPGGKKNSSQASDRPAYAETDYPQRNYGWSSLRALRSSKYLFIDAPRKELYDQSTDPAAKHDLSSSASAVGKTLSDQLDTFRRKTSSATPAPEVTPDPRRSQQLAALGYVASNDTHHAAGSALVGADPKDKIQIANLLEDALAAQEDARYQDAIQILQKVLEMEPDNAVAYQGVGSAWMALQDFEKAAVVLRKAVALHPDSPFTRSWLAMALFQGGDAEGAASQLEAAIRLAPRLAELHLSLAAAYERMNRVPDAIKELETNLEIDPDSYDGNLMLGNLLIRNGSASDAVPRLQKAAELRPNSPTPHTALAQAYSKLGQQANAMQERILAQRARASDPN